MTFIMKSPRCPTQVAQMYFCRHGCASGPKGHSMEASLCSLQNEVPHHLHHMLGDQLLYSRKRLLWHLASAAQYCVELWQSGWGYIPSVSSDGATVSPDPSCLQYLCCSSLCVGGLGSVCYIWSTSSVLSGVLCEFKYALSNSLFLSCLRTTWHDDSLLSPVHLAMLLLQFQLFCLRLLLFDHAGHL